MSQWDYKIDQPMPGPFPFPNLRKGPGNEVDFLPDKNLSVLRHIVLNYYIFCQLSVHFLNNFIRECFINFFR